MPNKIITAHFSKKGSPQLGLSPTIKIWEITSVSNVVVIPSGNMSEIGDGLYKYTHTSYDYAKNYAFIIDGGASLGAERYQISVNESYVEDISSRVYEEPVISHNTVGSFGELIANTNVLIELLLKYSQNRTKIDSTTKTLTIYDDDNITPIQIFQLKDTNGNPSITNIFERI